ncbi:hypothetical protein, partial [Pseudobutyrivibrio sp.]
MKLQEVRLITSFSFFHSKSEGQAVLGRQDLITTPWLTERHGYDPTYDEPQPTNIVATIEATRSTLNNFFFILSF